MFLTANILVSVFIVIQYKLDVLPAFFVGILVYFVLNLIPHMVVDRSKLGFVHFLGILDISFGFALLAFLIMPIYSSTHEITISYRKNDITFDLSTFIAALANAIVYFVFLYLNITKPKNDLLNKILTVKNYLEYRDDTFWGMFVHIALSILALSLILRIIELPSLLSIFQVNTP